MKYRLLPGKRDEELYRAAKCLRAVYLARRQKLRTEYIERFTDIIDGLREDIRTLPNDVVQRMHASYSAIQYFNSDFNALLNDGEDLLAKEHSEEIKHNFTGIPSTAMLYAELQALQRDMDLTITSKGLDIKTPEIILTDPDIGEFNFGEFTLSLKFDDLCNNLLHLYAFQFERVYYYNGYYHPHVNDSGVICLGDGYDQVYYVWQTGQLYTLFLLLVAILQTYNPRSPYVPLEKLVDAESEGPYCHVCGELADEPHTCDDCEETICVNCMHVCSRYVICDDCMDLFFDRRNRHCERRPCYGQPSCFVHQNSRCRVCGAVYGNAELTECPLGEVICLHCVDRLRREDDSCGDCQSTEGLCPLDIFGKVPTLHELALENRG